MNTISRRRAIKTIAAGGSIVLLSPRTIFSTPRASKDKLGVALVGLGYYSTDLLAPALQQTRHCYLAGIVTGTPAKAQAWQRKYNIPDKNVYNYQNFDSIANNPDIDVVYIVLPPSMHKEYVIKAANAGKEVWCEKPMALTEAECTVMIDACRTNKKSLAIGYRLQHEPNTQEWRALVKGQQLGKVKKVNCAAGYRENRTDHWKQKKEMGGGVLYDMGVYAIQGARLGTGMEPTSILSAQTSTTRPEIYKNGLDETTIAMLEFFQQCLCSTRRLVPFATSALKETLISVLPLRLPVQNSHTLNRLIAIEWPPVRSIVRSMSPTIETTIACASITRSVGTSERESRHALHLSRGALYLPFFYSLLKPL